MMISSMKLKLNPD